MQSLISTIASYRRSLKDDFLASLVVFLVALPLCMAIAIASGAPVAAGLITGIVAGLVVGWLAGCPLQVSGPAAGLTIVVLEIIQQYGLETLGVIVLLGGVIQLLAGVVRLGQWFRAVSPAVVKGMLAGIGVLIFSSQFHVMIDDKPKEGGLQNLITIPAAVAKAFDTAPSLGSPESRNRKAELLYSVGELHRQQVIVEEHVAEYAPHHGHDTEVSPGEKPSGLPETDIDLPALIEQQQRITTTLAAIVQDLERRRANGGGESARTLVAARSALAANRRALSAVRQGRLSDAVELQDKAVATLETLLASVKNHGFAVLVGILTIGAIVAWGGFAPRKLRFIPAPLIAIMLATAVSSVWVLPVLYVEVPDRIWEEIHFPSWTVIQERDWLALLGQAAFLAVIASAETLLSANAVDRLQNGPRTRYDRELCAQGVGNILCGILGALPMTGVIVRSSANVQAGAKTRISSVMHGLWLLLFVSTLAFVLRMIPMSSLAAVLVYTGYKLVNWKSVRELADFGWGEVAIYSATVVTIVVAGLLEGVLLGVALAAVKLLYTFSRLRTHLELAPEKHQAVLRLEGAATFVRLPRLAAELERVPPTAELHVDVEHLDYIDHACLDLLMTWAAQHESTGGRLSIDWDSLKANFHRNGAARKTAAK